MNQYFWAGVTIKFLTIFKYQMVPPPHWDHASIFSFSKLFWPGHYTLPRTSLLQSSWRSWTSRRPPIGSGGGSRWRPNPQRTECRGRKSNPSRSRICPRAAVIQTLVLASAVSMKTSRSALSSTCPLVKG